MATTAGITGTASTTGTTATSAASMGSITGNDFLKVLLAQLQFQDPLKPMDNQQMVQQMATIRELEMNTNLSKKLEQLTDQQRFSGATALMGKHVKGTLTDSDGKEYPAEGVVKSVRFTDKGDVILELDSGQSLPIADLQQIEDQPVAQTQTVPVTA